MAFSQRHGLNLNPRCLELIERKLSVKKSILLNLNFAFISALAVAQTVSAQTTINLSVMARPSVANGGRGGGAQ